MDHSICIFDLTHIVFLLLVKCKFDAKDGDIKQCYESNNGKDSRSSYRYSSEELVVASSIDRHYHLLCNGGIQVINVEFQAT